MKEKLRKYGELLTEVPLKNYNTFRVGGVCKYMVFPRTHEDVQGLIATLNQEHVKYFVLGNGSNVLFSSKYYDGVIISLKNFQKIEIREGKAIVGAGVLLPKLSLAVIKAGYSGFEWASGIPGTVGGSIYGNAGAYKESIFDFLETVTVLTRENEIKTILARDLSSGYRTSWFKENPGAIILEATFSLQPGNFNDSMEKISKRRIKRAETQPLEYPSAGSVFRNPSVDHPSGKIIEDLGLKGMKIGGAEVSQKHANFIVNTGNATSEDVRNLIELVHKEVKEKLNIDLVLEQEYVGWD